jgi:hypothetical protein
MKKLGSLLRTIGGVVVFLLLGIPVFGPPLYVEARGEVAPGTVVGRREEVSIRYTTWSRRFYLDVSYRPADTGAEERIAVAVDVERYDRARLEDGVQLRYMPLAGLRQLGSISAPRLADQGPLGQLRAQLGGATPLLGIIALWLVLLALWARWRRWWLALPLALGLLGGGLYAVSNPPPRPPPGPQLQGEATVEQSRLIDDLTPRRSRNGPTRAPQPYQIVVLSFVPRGGAGPVKAVDLVDDGSVALEAGASVPIHYSAADPRRAQIDGATRDYPWKNLLAFFPIVLLLVAIPVGLALLGGRLFRSRRQPAP